MAVDGVCIHISSRVGGARCALRVQKVLYEEEQVTLSALGKAMSALIVLVDILDKKSVATVSSIQTDVVSNTEGKTQARLRITLARGERYMLLTPPESSKIRIMFSPFEDKTTGSVPKSFLEKLYDSLETNLFCVSDAREALATLKDDVVSSEDVLYLSSILVHQNNDADALNTSLEKLSEAMRAL